MQSLRELADELNRERLARARQQPSARRHLALRGAARLTDRDERRMRRRARDLVVAGSRPCFGVAVMLAAPLLSAGTANAITAPSPAGNAPVVSAWNATAPDRAPAGRWMPPLVNRATRPTPPQPAAHTGKRYPRAFIEWKLSAPPSQQCR